jgi:hypothetical protein
MLTDISAVMFLVRSNLNFVGMLSKMQVHTCYDEGQFVFLELTESTKDNRKYLTRSFRLPEVLLPCSPGGI